MSISSKDIEDIDFIMKKNNYASISDMIKTLIKNRAFIEKNKQGGRVDTMVTMKDGEVYKLQQF